MKSTKAALILIAVHFTALIACNKSTESSNSSSRIGSVEVQIEGAELELLAKEPDIVTPTGVQVDEENRIWVIENHTHVRQEDYPGPDHDKILVFSGYINQDVEKKVTEFATDFKDGMSLSLAQDGKVLITTRASILEYTDSDGDLVADEKKTLISMETTERFPHNGMSGLVISPDNKIYFQCGENFGAYYEISGTDGTTLYGKEREGGSIYRCNLDGSGIERVGTAIWNCFAMAFDNYGNLFAVENDPDSRPPCRLLHIVRGGNYGFQFQHGRDGLSPLTSWFGQLPGTLPMVAGTGEAPSGILYYNQDKFGEEIKGSMLVTAWGDNEIESFQIENKGSSFTATKNSFVKGGRDFYPVGLATDDSGAVISTDWANVSYAVHGKGRIWRISNSKNKLKNKSLTTSSNATEDEMIELLNSSDMKVRTEAAERIASYNSNELRTFFQSNLLGDPGKMNLLWASHNLGLSQLSELLDMAIMEDGELLRAAAIRMMIDYGIQKDEGFYLNTIKNDASHFVQREAIYGLYSKAGFDEVVEFFEREDPFIHTAIIETFGKPDNLDFLLEYTRLEEPRQRLGALLCLRRSGMEQSYSIIPQFLEDKAEINRITALKWIAEDNLKSFRKEVEKSFNQSSEMSSELFDTYMATFQYLDGEFNQRSHFMEGDEHVSKSFYKRQKFLMSMAANSSLNYSIRARTLSGINPNNENLSLETLKQFSSEENTDFQVEAVRSIGARINDKASRRFLQEVVDDQSKVEEVRLEAISALSNSVKDDSKSKEILLSLANNAEETEQIREEAMRSLDHLAEDQEVASILQEYKTRLPDKESASSPDFWRELGNEQGNSASGARIFHSTRYQCNSCHRIDGRGGVFGPDLSQVGSNTDRSRIVESILNPSDIVTPTYTGYAVTTSEGDVTIGRLDKDLDSKRHLQMIDAIGARKAVAYDDIVKQTILETSLMPANLHMRMSTDEFRDLIQFLADQK